MELRCRRSHRHFSLCWVNKLSLDCTVHMNMAFHSKFSACWICISRLLSGFICKTSVFSSFLASKIRILLAHEKYATHLH